jgi:hypothetical protein
MFGEWVLNQMTTPRAPGFWLLISVIGGLIVIYLEAHRPQAQPRLLAAAHRVLIPYLGLVLGGLSPRLMGLNRIDWSAGLGIGLLLIFAVTALLILVRATVDLPDTTEESRSRREDDATRVADVTSHPIRPFILHPSTFILIVTCGVREFHWAFLRGAWWELLLTTPAPPEQPGYWAIWLATVFVLVELLFRRLSFAHTIFQIAIHICTGILFFYTLNFWLCWLLHTIAQFIAAPRALGVTIPRVQWGNRRNM